LDAEVRDELFIAAFAAVNNESNIVGHDETISYLKIIFWPNPPKADESRRWSLVLSPRHTLACLRIKTRLRLDLEPKSLF
jgi:hypothetical protein